MQYNVSRTIHPIHENVRIDPPNVLGLVKNIVHALFWPKNTKIRKKKIFLNFGGQTQTFTKRCFSQLFLNINHSCDYDHWKADIESFPSNFGLKSQTLKLAEQFRFKHWQFGKRA